MKAQQFNEQLKAVIQTALTEGECGFETMIGILECHKQALHEWRAQTRIAAAMAAATEPTILTPDKSIIKPN